MPVLKTLPPAVGLGCHRIAGLLLAFLALVGLMVWLVTSHPRPLVVSATFDSVDGLKRGDGVYLAGIRVGEVRSLRLAGRRVIVEVVIEAEHRHALDEEPHFFVWQDTLDPRHRALRIRPPTQSEPSQGKIPW